MADIYQQSLDWKEAMLAFEQIRTIQPDDEKARAQLIELSFRMGQEGRGLGELDNYLGYLDKKGESKKTLAFLENLANEHPQRIGLLRRVAERYYRVGRVGEAISLLDSAGEKLIDSGNINIAIQVIEMILALRPPNTDDYQNLLVQLRGRR
jgi:tetratricopeptide (TPR) repeat protein